MCLRYDYWMKFDLETLPDDMVYLIKFGHLETEIVSQVLRRHESGIEDQAISGLAGTALTAIADFFDDMDAPDESAPVDNNKPPLIIELYPTASEDDSESVPDLGTFGDCLGERPANNASPASFQHCSQLAQPSTLTAVRVSGEKKKSPNPSPTKRCREDTSGTTPFSQAFPDSDCADANGGYEKIVEGSDADDIDSSAHEDLKRTLEESFAEMRRREDAEEQDEDDATHLNSYLYSS
ncbi:unknown protein [Seminavis robusta]|uniref:Uncharacterized protein n=1 Tax=Seminavis robusta TaxID=568900 RepID=A0A9N8E7V3_9STRA|nr:unknown protein [Seminavis robusta]|eukprot:Sro639_g179760.1 n/a (238) ;mRNA; f:34792-35505